ncbi:MAG: ABC transporter permease [Clostridiales Family XIII bacterium]|jgi:peptide/nickel transport system permease protein|nr:ABC transporter permease [Clostridiales Family XIII bacterium]
MFVNFIRTSFQKTFSKTSSRTLLLLLGALFFLPAYFYYLTKRGDDPYGARLREIRLGMEKDGTKTALLDEVGGHVRRKAEFFGGHVGRDEIDAVAEARLKDEALRRLRQEAPDLLPFSFQSAVASFMSKPPVMALFVVFAFPAFIFLVLMANAYVKYTYERLIMTVFVVLGVTFLVFTILYISPMDASYNILGDLATQDQRNEFNAAYGLDKPYLEQLFRAFKGIVTLNPGKSLLGGEDVIVSLANKFPVTLQLTFYSLLLAVIIAVPSGILSALKPYSAADYTVMLLALIGLSIPAFWFGLILILNLSIDHKILPAIFMPGSWQSYIMPAVVMGTGLAASVARMTRSSMLEVIRQDFIMTAKAKGLSSAAVTVRHALGNAMIPVVTVVGIQFGAMMGGATVVEKVFNMPGIGNWLIDKQFIPDTPAVLAGVVYIAIVVSLVNLFVDILYAFLDPRIKMKIKGN